MTLGPYMTAEPVGTATRETYLVKDRRGGILATVEWFPRWRRYVLDPERGSVWSADCLRAVAAFMEREERMPTAHNVGPGVGPGSV